MLGLICGFATLCKMVYGWHKEGKVNTIAIDNARERGEELYIDYNGVTRYQKNDHEVNVHRSYIPAQHCGSGDLFYEDLKTGEIRNISLERLMSNFDKEANKAKERGYTVIPFGDDRNIENDIPGQRFIDIQTKEIYVKVFVQNKTLGIRDNDVVYGEYYLNPETKNLVRMTDEEKKKNQEPLFKLNSNNVIKWRNECQRLKNEKEKRIKASENFVCKWNKDENFRKKTKCIGDLDIVISK